MVMGQIRAGFIFAGFLVALAIYVPAQALTNLLWRQNARTPSHIFFKTFAALAGITVIQHGQIAKGQGGRLIISNHVSYFDTAALGSLHPVAFVAKSQVADWPLIGAVARLGGTVFVNRESRIAAVRDKQTIQDRLEGGETVVLFPEGTSSDGVRVLPFKSALFGAVERHDDAPDFVVQPVSLAYRSNYGLPLDGRSRPSFAWYGDMDFLPHKWSAYVQGPFEVVVRFHPPVRLSDFSSRKAMAAWCEEVVRRGLIFDLDGRTGAPELPEMPDAGQAPGTTAIAAE